MARRQQSTSRTEFCKPIVTALRGFGYPEVTNAQIRDVLDAWLAGKRGDDLPHGVIGAWAERSFNEIEETHPGRLALLENS